MPDKRIIVSVSNDLSNDQRVHRVCTSLQKFGYNVTLTGRKLRNSPKISREYKTRRFRLLFNKGILFYGCLNARLFWYSIFRRCDVLLANDLDTLAGLGMANILKRKKLVYDSHELFTEVPELENKRKKKDIWLFIEKKFITKADASYTVCNPIAEHYNKKYGINMAVVRNLPFLSYFPNDYENRERILIYQGALNKERGIEMMIDAMQYINDYKLILAGKGDLETDLKSQVEDKNLTHKVVFTGNLDFTELKEITKTARLGFSLEQGKSLNYKYSLPNKIFDYIQSGVPVICSDLPEMREVINDNKVGIVSQCSTGEELATEVNNLLNSDDILQYHSNCQVAAQKLNWENEQRVLKSIFKV